MSMIMNTLIVNQDGSFNYTPSWDSAPIGNIDGCSPEYIGSYVLFPIGDNVDEIFNVTSFDTATGQIIGTVNLNAIPSTGTAFGYGLVRCDSTDSYPSWNVLFSVQQLYVHYSKNPIEPYITSGSQAVTEVEIFAETYRSSDVFISLGVFSFRADNSAIVYMDISKILDAHLSNLVRYDGLGPYVTYGGQSAPMYYHSCKYYISSRYKEGGTFTEWNDQEQRIVVFGGRAYEDLSTENLNLTSGWLLPDTQTEILSAINKPTTLNALLGLAGSYYIRFSDYDELGNLLGTQLFNIVTNFDYIVYLWTYQPIGQTTIAELLDTTQAVIDTVTIRNRTSGAEVTEFLYLSGSGGFRNLSCEGSMISTIENNQELYETEKPSAYYLQTDIANFRVWKSKGVKRYKTATGFLPQNFIKEQVQDFILSPIKYVWDVNKWIPIIMNTKAAEYLNNKETNLRSFVFEYRHAFEDNIYNNR
jgi:hypothetical protein